MQVRPNEAFEALLTNGTPGLVGTMAVEVYDPTNSQQVLAPASVGVTEPKSGTYRVMLTVAPSGSFMIRWASPAGTEGEEELLVSVEPVVAPGIGPTPSINQIGALLRARTKTAGGVELGTFTDETRPTGSEVAVLIDEATADVMGAIGTPAPGSKLEGWAQRAAALYTAVLVELSYFPEQVARDRSPAETYLKLYKDRMKSLVAFVAQGGSDDDPDGGTGTPEADLSFDNQTVVDGVVYGQPMVGWGTRW